MVLAGQAGMEQDMVFACLGFCFEFGFQGKIFWALFKTVSSIEPSYRDI
jgi:hypothetical protein